MPVRAFFRGLHDRLSGSPPPTYNLKPSSGGGPSEPGGHSDNHDRPSCPTTTSSSSSTLTPTYQRRSKSRDNDARNKSKSPSPSATANANSRASSRSTSRTPRRRLRVQVPLYIYPTTTSWEPLFAALRAHPTVAFDVVINPANGPGPTDRPDENYVREVTRLNSFPNVTIYGYVHVQWAERSLEDVLCDVRRWERWNGASAPSPLSSAQVEPASESAQVKPASESASASASEAVLQPIVDIHISGLFVDEAPHHPAQLPYMASLHAEARRTLSRGALVWTNPGCPVAEKYYDHADRVTCFEAGYDAWLERGLEGMVGGLAVKRKSGVMVHSVPRGGGLEREVVRRAREEGVEGVFVTVERGYEGWGNGWGEVCRAVEEEG